MTGNRLAAVGAAALIGFALAYALPSYGHLPLVQYDPVTRRLFVAPPVPGLPLVYYGLLLWGLAGAVVAAALAAIVQRSKSPSPRALELLAAWTLTALLLVGAYFTWNNWP